MTVDLGPQAAEVARLTDGVRDEQLTGPTPCDGTLVAGLLDHLVGLTLAFRMAAEKTPLPGGPSADADHLPADWRERLSAQLPALAAAWRDPAAWEGETEVGGVRLPASSIGTIAVDELVLHGWDLAVATGQDYRPDPHALQACLEYVSAMAEPGNEAMRSGQFGPVVPVPADAAPLDRALGLAGRDPAWTPLLLR